jgi:hypothetical protein
MDRETKWKQIESGIIASMSRPRYGARILIDFLKPIWDGREVGGEAPVAKIPEEIQSLPNRVTELEAKVEELQVQVQLLTEASHVHAEDSEPVPPAATEGTDPFADAGN